MCIFMSNQVVLSVLYLRQTNSVGENIMGGQTQDNNCFILGRLVQTFFMSKGWAYLSNKCSSTEKKVA